MNDEKTYPGLNEEPIIAEFKSNAGLMVLNILPRMVLAALVVMLLYCALAIMLNSVKEDPFRLFLFYWPFFILLFLVTASAWTLWFHTVTIRAYKDKMTVKKRGKTWTIPYASVISFDLERYVVVVIPMPLEKTIVANGKGRINTVMRCSCLTKADFLSLHEICNTTRTHDRTIPLRKSTLFHT